MNHRQKRWRLFRQKWLRDDVGAQTHEPPWTTPELPLCIWPARRKVRRVVFLSKDILYRAWVERELQLPPDWLVISRIGFPDEPQLAILAGLHAQLRAPWSYVGDLDPLDLTAFLALRALAVDFVGRRPALPMTWAGLNDSWIALGRHWLDRGRKTLPTLPMVPLEREHWNVLREVAPELPAMLGPECTRLLDGGETLDVVGVANASSKPTYLARLLRLLATTARTSRRP